jgi:exodeoxyribonuclease V alpha subunit
MGKKVALAALTRRAAQRRSEMAGIEAKMIHRLLEFDPTSSIMTPVVIEL